MNGRDKALLEYCVRTTIEKNLKEMKKYDSMRYHGMWYHVCEAENEQLKELSGKLFGKKNKIGEENEK